MHVDGVVLSGDLQAQVVGRAGYVLEYNPIPGPRRGVVSLCPRGQAVCVPTPARNRIVTVNAVVDVEDYFRGAGPAFCVIVGAISDCNAVEVICVGGWSPSVCLPDVDTTVSGVGLPVVPSR